MTQQYLRNLSLVVADQGGRGLELGAFRVVFSVVRGDLQTPNSADIRVYNLSDNTANTIDTEFKQLSLKASYGSAPPQLIFRGSIKQVRKGREDQKNSYVDITAADGDEAYNFSTTAITLAAGTTAIGTVETLIAQMARGAKAASPTGAPGGQPIAKGYIPPLTTNKRTRARVLFGRCSDLLSEQAEAVDCKFSVQDGNATFIPKTSFIPGEPILITPTTGLIGVPEQTQNGLSLRVLLNPSIKIGQRIKLATPDINQLRYGLDSTSANLALTLARTVTKLNAQGLYYVMRAEHSGDTRGTNWYTNLTCLAIDASVPLDISIAQAVHPANFPTPRDAIKRY